MPILEFALWSSLFFLIWTYFIYPVLIWLLALLWPNPWSEHEFNGRVSLIIAAHNEEDVIKEKVENSLFLDFGDAEAEIIIVSDGSQDRTEEILGRYVDCSDKLKIVTYQPRSGKANALNTGCELASGDVLIFSDANVIIDAKSCIELLKPFFDKQVGAVCGKVLVRARGDDEVAGESMYMRYEGWVQRSESRVNSMVGIDGAFFAMRRELFAPLATNVILDDFSLSMEAPLAKTRIVYADRATAVEEIIPSADNELKRKARTISGGYQYLADLRTKEGSFSGFIWFELISHKILKWLAPWFLAITFCSNALLLSIPLYKLLFTLQCVFYFVAFLAAAVPFLRKVHVFYIPYYFCVVNYAAILGLRRFILHDERVLWEKVERVDNDG